MKQTEETHTEKKRFHAQKIELADKTKAKHGHSKKEGDTVSITHTAGHMVGVLGVAKETHSREKTSTANSAREIGLSAAKEKKEESTHTHTHK